VSQGAAKSFEEAHERHEHGREGPRWIPVAAASLAVLAALSGYFGNVRSTSALFAKNESIVATTRASDSYAQYQAERLKYYVSQSAIDQGVNPNGDEAKLRATAKREAAKAPPLLAQGKRYDEDAKRWSERSDQLLRQHETIEVGSTLFEVAIVLISMTALVGSRLLPITAGVAAALGMTFFLVGLFV
jgi:hypothetical protein